MMDIKVIRAKGDAVLVEWLANGRFFRGIVRREAVVDGRCPQDELDAAIPYGVPWAEIIGELNATPQQIEDELHRVGIWTAEEAHANPQAVLGAIQSAYGLGLAQLFTGLRKHQKEA